MGYVFSRPRGGWAGVIGAEPSAATTVPSTGALLATDGPTIATGGYRAVDVFTVKPGPPSARNASLSGLATGKPKLRFKLYAGSNAPRIKSFKVSLPHGLTFTSRARRRLAHGLTATGASKYGFALRHGELIVTLANPSAALLLRIHTPALIESRTLMKRVSKHRRNSAKLTVAVRLSDAAGRTTRLTLKIRPR